MARPKKPKYEYVEKLNLFRKRVKDISGKYVAVYGRTPDELTEKIMVFQEQQALGAENRDDPFFNDYAQRWMDLHGANLTFGGRTDYQSCIDCNIPSILKSLPTSCGILTLRICCWRAWTSKRCSIWQGTSAPRSPSTSMRI